jgi:hypothetical protein
MRKPQYTLRTLLLFVAVISVCLAAIVGGLYQRIAQVYSPIPQGWFLVSHEVLSYEGRRNGGFPARGKISCFGHVPFRATVADYGASGMAETLCAVNSSPQSLGHPETVVFAYELTQESLKIAELTKGSEATGNLLVTIEGYFVPPLELDLGDTETRGAAVDVIRCGRQPEDAIRLPGKSSDGTGGEELYVAITFEELTKKGDSG